MDIFDGQETELDGLVVLALVLVRVKPNYKSDMFLEVSKLKGLTLKQYGGDVKLYFDEMTRGKQRIDQKDRHFSPSDRKGSTDPTKARSRGSLFGEIRGDGIGLDGG